MTTITITTDADLGATFEFYTSQGNYTRTGTGPTWNYISTFTAAGNGQNINSASNVTGILIGPTVTSIGNGAFFNCSNLGSGLIFTIPNGIVSIGDNAFNGTKFTGFIINENLATIGSVALGSDNCATVSVGINGNPNFQADSNVLYTTSLTTLIWYPQSRTGTSYTIPDATTTIGQYAFAGSTIVKNTTLTTIITGTGLINIQAYAFQGCSALTTFTYLASTGLTTLGNFAFTQTGFTIFVIPNSVTSMGATVFNDCNSLTSLTIGSGVPSGIDFGFMEFLQTYLVNGASTNYSATNGVLYDISGTNNTLIRNPLKNPNTNLIIPNGVKAIGNQASSNGILVSLSIPASVTLINYYAFGGNAFLTSVTLASGSNPTAGAGCFENCIILTDIYIPASFTNLNVNDFGYCTKLITDSVPSGGPYEGTLHTDAVPGDTVYNLFLPAGTNGYYVNYDGPPPVCFKEGSKILRVNSETGNEEYIVIQDLRKGDLIKTVSSGLKKIEHIGYSKMYNNVNAIRSNDKLYRCSTSEYSELTEDLIITGCHSILIKNFKDQEQIEKTQEVLGKIYITEKHYRLPACVDERTKIFEEEGVHTIWHFSLEHSDYYMNYGVYANGLLVETTSHRMMLEISGMTLV
jgi:hypothetical protein